MERKYTSREKTCILFDCVLLDSFFDISPNFMQQTKKVTFLFMSCKERKIFWIKISKKV